MAAPIKADIIYYCSASDFELEFNLCGCCTMRLLSDKPQDRASFVRSLGRAVSRSQLLFVVGQADGENALLPNLCSAIGYPLETRDLSGLGAQEEITLPKGSIPLVTSDGRFGGCVIECGPQAIIALTDDRDLRKQICRELLFEYVRDLSSGINKIEESNPDCSLCEKIAEKADDQVNTPEAEGVAETENLSPFDTVENNDDISEQLFTGHNDEPAKPEKKHKFLKRLFIFFLTIAFLFGGLVAYMFFIEPVVIKKIYKDYSAMHAEGGISENGIIDSMAQLYEYNSDTIGYLEIDGTDIACPIVTEINKEAGYYEHHLFNDWYSYFYGTPYIKGEITAEQYYRNIVIYGPDCRGKLMLSDIADMVDLDGYRKSPTIKFDTLYSSDTYKIFAVFTYSGEIDDMLLKDSFDNDKAFEDHLQKLLELSSIKTTVEVSASDEIITIISQNTVVVARRLRAEESELVDTQNAMLNDGTTTITAINKTTAVLPGLMPYPAVMFDKYSNYYEQAAPLSPEDILLNAEKYLKEEGYVAEASPENPMETFGATMLTVYDIETKKTVSGTTYDIICQIVEAEMGEAFEPEALKAQAIATYGWLLTSGAEGDGAPAVRLKSPSSAVSDAVSEVIGIKPYFGLQVAHTMYFPLSAGYTADSAVLYQKAIPYLATIDSSIDRNHRDYITHRTYKASDICEWVLAETGVDLSKVDKDRWFNVSYDSTGTYAQSVWFGNTTTLYSGRFLRERIFTTERVGEETIDSVSYKITYQPVSDTFFIEVRGWGHGIGMSQYGANELAENGMSYAEILKHYYGNITLWY